MEVMFVGNAQSQGTGRQSVYTACLLVFGDEDVGWEG
jgi:hypothetical protein